MGRHAGGTAGAQHAQNIERIEPQFQITPSGVQWFDLDVAFASSGGETFSGRGDPTPVLSGQSHTRLKNGKIALIDTGAVEELQEVLLDCAPQQHGQGYRINNKQAGFLEATSQQHGLAGPGARRLARARRASRAAKRN